MVKECRLSSGKLPLGGLLRTSVVRMTDRPNMASAVYRGRKATSQTNKQEVMDKYLKLSFLSF